MSVEMEHMMRNVKVTYHNEDGAWWAESPDVPTYSAAAATFGDLRQQVREGLPFLLEVDAIALEERLADGALIGDWTKGVFAAAKTAGIGFDFKKIVNTGFGFAGQSPRYGAGLEVAQP